MNELKLPHPIRTKYLPESEQWIEQLDKIMNNAFQGLDLETCTTSYLVSIFSTEAPKLVESIRNRHESEHTAGIEISSLLFPYKFRALQGNILTTSDIIDKMLEDTDIGDDIPSSYLRPPFSCCFIEFTESRCSNIKIFNEQSGEHILEGVYICDVTIEPNSPQMERYYQNYPNSIDPKKPLRIVEMMFTGSPLGKQNILDDALRIQEFHIQNDSNTIKTDLTEILALYGSDSDFVGDLDYLKNMLDHMAKVLLFTNCKQYRDTVFNERDEILKKIESLKSPGKIKKLHTKLKKIYNRIIIKPEDRIVYDNVSTLEHSSGHKPKAAHWRRGHFREQPYGPGATKRKILFIAPTVVGGIFADKKSYDVKPKIS